MTSSSLIADLRRMLGEAAVIDAAEELEYYAHDVFEPGAPLAAVLRPKELEALGEVVAWLAERGIGLIPRGGGLSYTRAYLADQAGCVLLDTRGMDRILEVNAGDRYVHAQCGLTWAALDGVLAPMGLRTPYFGPLSGLESTLGGALSQGSVFLGSGRHGAVADSVLALSVMDGRGRILRTGAAAAGSPPFLRHFGPDLSGAFLGDAGSLGIKLDVSLRLIPRPAAIGFLSWQHADVTGMLAGMAELARAGLASECFGFDPVLAAQRMKRAGLATDAKALGAVVRRQGLLSGLRLALRGRGFLDPGRHSLHASIEADSAAELRARQRAARRLLAATGGSEIEASIPRVLRAQPFQPPNTILGPAGERWVPVHGILPHSRAAAAQRTLDALFAERRETMARHKVAVGQLYATVGAQATLIEPVFYWPDAHGPFHRRRVEAAYLKQVGEPPAAPENTAAVAALKREVADLLRAQGAVHFQLGRFYQWREGIDAGTLAMYDALKQALDPAGIFNPGVLQR